MNYFLVYHLDVIERAISNLHKFVKRKAEQSVQVAQELDHMNRFNYRQRELLHRAVQKPELPYTFKSHQTSHGISYASARSDLLELVEEGLLRQYKVGRAMHFMPVTGIEKLLKKQLYSASIFAKILSVPGWRSLSWRYQPRAVYI